MSNKKELAFTLVADGTPHSFQPFKNIGHPFDKRKCTQLEFYREYVAFRDSPMVYILDNTGNILK